MKYKLLTRDQFRAAVFQRDKYLCVCCKNNGQDAHHIIERRLFPDGGYYIDNGATLCGECHIKAEQTILTVEEIRIAAGINTVILPPHAYNDQQYDKWLNPILENGMRVKGELFEDVSVQKVLEPVLHLFTDKVKYPRTYHLPWSPGATKDDKILSNDIISSWNWEVVITEKMDGEQSNLYKDGIHARSIDYDPHPSRNQIKALHAQIAHNIPKNWRICCENLTAKHSIKYTNLKSYCNVFSIWDGCTCLGWDDTVTFASILDLQIVPILWRGIWNPLIGEKFGLDLASKLNLISQEGYVIRPAATFQLKDFRNVVGKYVRKDHVDKSRHHWKHQKIEYNELISML